MQKIQHCLGVTRQLKCSILARGCQQRANYSVLLFLKIYLQKVQNTGPLTGHFPATAMPFRVGKTREDVLDAQPDMRRLHWDNLSFLKLSISGQTQSSGQRVQSKSRGLLAPGCRAKTPPVCTGWLITPSSACRHTGTVPPRWAKSSGPSERCTRPVAALNVSAHQAFSVIQRHWVVRDESDPLCILAP